MIQGCTSDAGKSYLAAGFCRLYANRGIRVAPFKAQNMSNNAGVTPDGGEIGRAQLLQAQAARLSPSVYMNPVLLKPEADSMSQVILLGKAQPQLKAIPWQERKDYLWETVKSSLQKMQNDYDLLIIEGAGSPAEINLRSGDIVNMRIALEAQAQVLLTSDIDRGGSFAHLLGTWHCLERHEQQRIAGFLLNKFRGDASLLGNAMEWLEGKTQIPTLGVIPMLNLPLPTEDAYSQQAGVLNGSDSDCVSMTGQVTRIAIIRTPYMSNFDEFDALINEPDVQVAFVDKPTELADVVAVIIPGSKHVSVDLEFLKQGGFAARLHQLAAQGVQILGVCGGMQMLGRSLNDPHNLEGGYTSQGLGLLAIDTTLEAEKTTQQTTATLVNSGAQVTGYEIHHGKTSADNGVKPYLKNQQELVIGYVQGNIAGMYAHGLFDNAVYRQEFLQKLGIEAQAGEWSEQVDAALDTLALHLEKHCDMAAIDRAIGLRG
ncbi:cobyric acid synthase CobQ [Leucothrix pacifica]|uniref:Cobyric acid synthase n=2 Tax=Leucothrix pacifica TaxID=1247513 RepID=A0A317CPJ2_9GAMM|nr:cobyric acid synthase CobQ [Leucothrix pacifica]